MTARTRIAPRQRRQAFSLVEALVSTFVVSLVVGLSTNLFVSTSVAADRSRVGSSVDAAAQVASDEILYQLRGASQVLSSQSIQGTSYSTDNQSTIVFQEPGIDNSNGGTILSTVKDYVAFSLIADPNNAGTKMLVEQAQPDSTSIRASHTNFVLAKNVTAVSYTYRVRDQFQSTATGTVSFSLTTTPSVTPVDVYVNGVKGSGTYSAPGGSQKSPQVSVPSLKVGDDVEIVYTVNPTTNSSALASVTDVDMTITVSAPVSDDPNRTIQQTCSARLRNQRI